MIKLSKLIGLKLINEETFTATNKASGKTSVFKSKDSRDAAIKAGTHFEKEDDKSVKTGGKTPKVNIFDKPSKSKTSEPTSQSKNNQGNTSSSKPNFKSKLDVERKIDNLKKDPSKLENWLEDNIYKTNEFNNFLQKFPKYKEAINQQIEILKNPKASASQKKNALDSVKMYVNQPFKNMQKSEVDDMDADQTIEYVEKNKDKFNDDELKKIADLEREIELVSSLEFETESDRQRERLENKRFELTFDLQDIVKDAIASKEK